MLDCCSLSQVIVKLCLQHDFVAWVSQRQLILVLYMPRLFNYTHTLAVVLWLMAAGGGVERG